MIVGTKGHCLTAFSAGTETDGNTRTMFYEKLNQFTLHEDALAGTFLSFMSFSSKVNLCGSICSHLNQVVVRTVQVFVQLDYQALEKR